MKEAHKNGVELIITGESNTRQIKDEKLYYDTFYFYETNLSLYLMRTDTGDIIYEKTYTSMAYNTDENTAIDKSVVIAARDAANEIVDYYYDTWDKIFLNDVNYQLMVTGIEPDGLDLIKQKIALLHPDTEIYVRSHYNGVAILNLVLPLPVQELRYLIKTSPYPNFKIVELSGDYLEAQKEY